jgi:hypothetical protein
VVYVSLQKDPSVYIKSYSDLQSWISQALEAYKHEILGVSFPVSAGGSAPPLLKQAGSRWYGSHSPAGVWLEQVFVHCYLKAVERGQPEQGAEFLKTWRQEHEEFYPQEMQALGMVTTPEQIQARTHAHSHTWPRSPFVSHGLP